MVVMMLRMVFPLFALRLPPYGKTWKRSLQKEPWEEAGNYQPRQSLALGPFWGLLGGVVIFLREGEEDARYSAMLPKDIELASAIVHDNGGYDLSEAGIC